MALFYDRDFGRGWNRSYDRGYRGHSGWSDFEGGYDYGAGPGRHEYDRGYVGDIDRGTWMRGGRYDAGYKSRWQTDYGDPFNDRGSHTPFRMTRGGYRGTGDRDYGWGMDYDREYSANPTGYDPYYSQPRGPFARGRWWRRSGYDQGWR